MKRLFLTLFVLVLGIGTGIADADAKRLGGGRSSGIQRESVTRQATTPPTRAADASSPTAAGATAQPPRRSWLGPLAGLAAGLGLAALASHLGLGGELGSLLLIGLVVLAAVMVFRMLARRREPAPAMQYAGMGAGGGVRPLPDHAAPAAAAASAPSAQEAPPAAPLPAGFDGEGFVRQAKASFLRLQAANDAGNLDDLREFLSPEMFAEVQLQLTERGPAPQHTEVVMLDAEIVDWAEEAQRLVVSVRFHGLIREEADAAPVDFDEVWHLARPAAGGRNWVVAGIQQLR